MNDFGKAGRYLVKRDAAGFLRWLLAPAAFTFRAWIDARRVALPDQGDLTHDLLAALSVGNLIEVVLVEFKSEARGDTVYQVAEYLARILAEPGGEGRLPPGEVGAIVVNLSGRAGDALRSAPTTLPGCRYEVTPLYRNLQDDDAAALVAGVAAGEVSWWQLGWAPLMRGGDNEDVIRAWQAVASREPDELERMRIATLAVALAELRDRKPLWSGMLRGWGVKTSSLFDEARAEGGVAISREFILTIGRQRFGHSPPSESRAELEAIDDLGRFRRLRDRILIATSWADLLATE